MNKICLGKSIGLGCALLFASLADAAGLSISNTPLYVTQPLAPNVILSPVYSNEWNEVSVRHAPWLMDIGQGATAQECYDDPENPCHDYPGRHPFALGMPFTGDHVSEFAFRVIPWPGVRVDETLTYNKLYSEVSLYPGDRSVVDGNVHFKPLDYLGNGAHGGTVNTVLEERAPDPQNVHLAFEGKARYTRSNLNFLYYDKALDYKPWPTLGSHGFTSYLNATEAATPRYHPIRHPEITADLASAGTHKAVHCMPVGVNPGCDDRRVQDLPHFLGQYWTYNGGDVWKHANYSGTRWDDTGTPMSDADKINFAHWFTYWRSSDLAGRGLLARLVDELGSSKKDLLRKLRLGIFHADTSGNKSLDLVVRDSEADLIQALGDIIYTQGVFTERTSIEYFGGDRRLQQSVWEPFMTVDYFKSDAPYRDDPRLATSPTTNPLRSCRRNYEIVISPDYTSLRLDTSYIKRTTDGQVYYDPEASDHNYDGDLGPPYADSYPMTMGDIGAYGWKTDLRTDLADNLLPSKRDEQRAQHLVRYVIGPFDEGVVFNRKINSHDEALEVLKASPANTWNDPWYSFLYGPDGIDDLWHMALNSRGFFYGGENIAEALDNLLVSLNDILVNTVSGTSVATSTTSLSEGDLIYQATVDNDYKGHLRAYNVGTSVNGDGNAVLDVATGTPVWDLAAKLVAADSPERKIATYDGTSGIPFKWASLSRAIKDKLNVSPPTGITEVDVYGERLLEYLRGSGTCEDGSGTACTSGVTYSFRRRNVERDNRSGYSSTNPFGRNILGDIANSNPWLVAAPVAGPSDVDYPGYNDFRVLRKSRQKTLYVGANDGMLHAVNADDGNELFAYVPSFVHDNLHELSRKTYDHKYFVDGSPFAADVNVGGWKTLLAGGGNRGGKGYYLLDVTNPAGNTEANSADWVKWEFTHPDMYYTYNLPLADGLGQARQFVRTNNEGRMALIVGNGYPEDANKQACLFIIYLSGPTGTGKTWLENDDYRKLCAGNYSYEGDGADGGGIGTNGLSTPTPYDTNGDGKVDVIYAGDLNGNMWRFDVGSSDPAEWGVAYGGEPLFVAKNASNVRQPIITPPEVTTLLVGSETGQLLLFGTGKYIEQDDISNAATQSFYGVWDRGLSGVKRANLIAQVLDAETSIDNVFVRKQTSKSYPSYCSSGTDLAACGTSAKHLGWYWDMPASGERLTGKVSLINGMVFFNTFFPYMESYVVDGVTKYRLDPCKYGGDGWLMGLNAVNGYIEDRFSVFDVNQDGVVDSTSDAKVAGVKVGASMGGTSFARGLKDMMIGLYAPTNKESTDKEIDHALVRTDPASSGRVSWFELLD